MSKIADRLSALLGIGGGWLAVLLVGWPSLAYPLGRDNGIFAYCGWAVLRGQVPYAQFWEHKTPAIFFIYAAIERIFGVSEAGVRRGDLAYSLLVVPFFYLLVSNLFGRRAAVCATITWAIFHTALNTLYFWSGAESETFMVLPFILAYYAYRQSENTSSRSAGRARLWVLAAGLAAGLAIMIKVTAVVGLFALAVYAVVTTLRDRTLQNPKARVQALLSKLGLAVLGVGLAILPFVVYFASQGALREAVDVSIVANFFYGQGGSDLGVAAANALGRAGDNLLHLRVYYLLPALALVYIALRERTRATLLIALWLLCAFAMTWVQGRLWPYHYIGTLVPLSVLSGFVVDRLFLELARRKTANRPSRLPAALLTVLIFGLTVSSLAPNNGTETVYSWDRYQQYASGRITARQYQADFHRGTYDYLPNADAARYIAAHTQAGDRVLVWAVDPLVNFLADRLAPGRFIYNYPIISPDIPIAARAEYQRIFMAELVRNPPAIIAVAVGDTSPITDPDSLTLLREFPAFGQYITDHYTDQPFEIPPSRNKVQTFLIYTRR